MVDRIACRGRRDPAWPGREHHTRIRNTGAIHERGAHTAVIRRVVAHSNCRPSAHSQRGRELQGRGEHQYR